MNVQPPNRRTGTIAVGPAPAARASNVAVLTRNLEEAPMVAKLVSQGLLKTEDIMNQQYVRDMEKTLMRQKITKETEARDFPSRRSARRSRR